MQLIWTQTYILPLTVDERVRMNKMQYTLITKGSYMDVLHEPYTPLSQTTKHKFLRPFSNFTLF